MMQKKHNPTIIVYNITDDIPPEQRGFRVVGKVPPGSALIKEGVLPGAFGYKDLYIRHIPKDKLLVISYTHTELSEADRQDIGEKAVQWLKAQN